MKLTDVKIGKRTIKAKVANNFFTRAKGLMFKKNIEKDEGVVFVFKKDSFPKFWMFGMRFPLDIIWISSKKKIVDITLNAKPSLNPRKIYKPKKACKYVLETRANLLKNIEVGKVVNFEI